MPTQDTPVINSPPKLLDQVRDKLRVKHSSIRTESVYVDWIKRHIRFHDKSHSETTELCQAAGLGQPLA
ncbi:MAG: hypothetical protein EPO47_10140 [Rugosibacter sp.]|nr:MAG: hypothetical protein EPO60_03275 [Rugosibacter sp.]TBR07862.1 MAG: hypothetical protein EPO47_10140 [Rugosibacter sp.]